MAGLLLARLKKAALLTGAVFALVGCVSNPDETFFDAGQGGGDPVWLQHWFWFFGHPEVYLPFLVLFLIGISLLLKRFAPRVWARLVSFFKISKTIPGLWIWGAITVCVVGVIPIILMSTPHADMLYHDTYFVVAHWHFTLMIFSLFLFGALVFWAFPAIVKLNYNEHLARLSFGLAISGFLVLTIIHLRFPDSNLDSYDTGHDLIANLNLAIDVGIVSLLLSAALIIVTVIEALVKKRPLPHKPVDPSQTNP